MQHTNINFKKKGEHSRSSALGRFCHSILGRSSHNFANRLRCASAHREQANADTMHVGANRTRRSLNKSPYSKIAGWSLAMLMAFGMFGYLTFIPEQTFAADDIVDPDEHRSLSQISTMQEMSRQICINSRNEESKQLEDNRDGKTYWVTKLADGNCWMAQNLDFDIPPALDPATSDVGIDAAAAAGVEVSGGMILTNISGATTISNWPSGNMGNDFAKNYATLDKDYIYIGPNNDHGFNTSSTCNHVTSITDTKCRGYFKLLSDYPASQWSDMMHYHTGNYYSYSAATVGSADNKLTDGDNATMSICPKGWQLPTSGDSIGEFKSLMLAYGWNIDSPNNIAIDMNNNKGIQGAPLYLLYGGVVNGHELLSVGASGYYWSSTTLTNYITDTSNYTRAYYLTFDKDVHPFSNASRHNGLSVRCVAKGGQPSDNTQANVAITVSPVISIDVTKDANGMTVDFTKVATSTIVARAGSNQPYQVLLSTEQSNLTNPKTSQTIPMIPSDQTIVKGTSSWGIKKLASPTDTGVNENTIYSPVGINGNKALFYESTSAASEDLTFPVAIAVDSSLPSGQYSTQVTLTAVAM